MKANVRACIAYAAGRIILQKDSCRIFDCTLGKDVGMDGTIEKNRVEICDEGKSCRLDGKGYKNSYEIYNFVDSHYVELVIDGNQFRGYDFGKFAHFTGEVRGESISLFDHEVKSHFDYNL